ncbi:MAG: aldo/keto reductase [bacterium]|nr:aldo/keto reductase [bacterium]
MDNLNKDSRIKLNNGVEMPVIGFGTYKIPEGEEVENAVKWAFNAGYRMIDTAKIYKNEEGVGRAIKQYGLLREEFFITTKVWNEDQGYENTLEAIDQSLKKLGLAYVDLYLVHWPTADPEVNKSINKREETWKAMEEIYKSGKAKAIGVSNYTMSHLREMEEYATIMPAVNQVEFNPFLYQEGLLNYCKKNNIVLEAYCPLARAKRLEEKHIVEIAKKYNKTPAEIFIRWSLQRGAVPIPKSVHKDRIKENIDVFDFELSEEDMKLLDRLDENMHLASDPTNLL